MAKVGVFDSGIGGESVAAAIRQALPDLEVVIKSDSQHMPYGDKTPAELLGFVVPILNNLVDRGCEAIIIACNTVTVTLIDQLRKIINVPLVGIEPMIKPAVRDTKTGTIAVCATPATLASERYTQLKRMFAQDITVIEPDCRKWAYMIEHDQINEQLITKQISEVCSAGADVIVLGCTHYHWIEGIVQAAAAGKARVIQPEAAVVNQLKKVLRLHP